MISIGFNTNRAEPRFQWFCDSLASQLSPEMREQVEVVFIDFRLFANDFWANYHVLKDVPAQPHAMIHDLARAEKLKSIVADRFHFLHMAPMPCRWNGPFRQTKENYFAAGNARNTFLTVAKHPYLVHVDDLSVLMPGWFNQVMHASHGKYCVAGAYKKMRDMVVENGKLVSFTDNPSGVDSRWPRGSDDGVVQWSGAGLYGCSFGAPLDLMIKVNGTDGHCESQGGEDYDLGIRLERAGGQFFYNRNMLTIESEEEHFTETPFKRIRKVVTQDRLPPNYEGETFSDHVMLNRVNRENRYTTLSDHSIIAMREKYQRDGTFSVPQGDATDWRDGQPLSEL